MEKLNTKKLEYINGGVVKCGWVGVGGAILYVAIGASPLLAIGGLFGMSGAIERCWNS